jgi:hypothetical protein
MKRTWHGSCHCGAVRFEADLDLALGTARCNCSFCARVRNWAARGEPGDLRVIAGEDRLGRYSASGPGHEHCFCQVCGVRLFSRGEIEGMGPFVTVMVTVLEGAHDELVAAPVIFQDGLHDNWWNPPADTRGL